jgi:two-component system sensor histidine kinase HydH
MKILQLKRMYLPAFSILTVVILLLVLIGISTYRNLDHAEKTALKFVHQQGLSLTHALEAGTRAGMIIPMQEEDTIEILIREAGKDRNIVYIYIIDAKGKVIHHSNPSFTDLSSAWLPVLDNKVPVRSRLRNLPNGEKVYDLAKRFHPQPVFTEQSDGGMMGNDHYMAPHQRIDNIIVLGLKMTAFEAARRSDKQHALVMAAILLILGSGAIFFIFVIQNYYLVDKALRQTRDYTRQVVASMANGLLSIDADGKIVSYNLLALELLGIDKSRVKGMDLKTVIDFKSTGIENTLKEGRPIMEYDYYHRNDSGTSVPMTLSVTQIPDEQGNRRGAVIVLRDLREIKHLEEKIRRSEKMAAVGKLAAGVAHEIRNPLSSIKGFAKFLSHSLSDRPREQEYAGIMAKEVDRINSVVTDLLTFARPLKFEPVPTDVAELVEHTVRLVEADARRQHVDIHRRIMPGLKKSLLDANQITQALLNLLLNSFGEVDSGGTITVGAEHNGFQRELKIWVEDNGPGIPKNLMDKIFDPFYTTKDKGTGLGLAIVHKIAENHGAEILVESPLPGIRRGCRFTLIFPLNDSS